MPVHSHKKDITPNASGSTQDQPGPPLPDQQTFRQYLRELARSAIRVVLEEVMREELDALIGVGWGECSPKRKGYRISIRHGDKADSTIILTVLGVDGEGNKEVLTCARVRRKAKRDGSGGSQDLRSRGATKARCDRDRWA